MTDRHLLFGLAALTIAALLVAGCGGGGDEVATGEDTATVTGTVTTSGVTTTQADGGTEYQPVPDCPVIVQRASDGAQLGSTTTDDQGQYRFEQLQQDQEITVQAQLQNGQRLMNQFRTQDRTHRADVNPDTTMATACRRLVTDGSVPADPDIDAVADATGDACLQYQQQHGFQWRGGSGGPGGPGEAPGPPDFADNDQVCNAAGELLRTATNQAISVALQNRGEDQCLQAVNMISAWLRHANGDVPPWAGSARNSLATAMQEGITVDTQQVADAVSTATGEQVTAQMVANARDQVRTDLEAFAGTGPDMECVEAVAAMCIGDGASGAVRLTERTQITECAQLLAGTS